MRHSPLRLKILSKTRLDLAVSQCLGGVSIKESEAYIRAGLVWVDAILVDKPGTEIREGSEIIVKKKAFVSRGGEKLAGLVEQLGLALHFRGACVLDIGASTGGFTDCALQNGACRVYAIDVGTAQLHWRLKTDPRVLSYEKTDIRSFLGMEPPAFDIVLADISFNRISSLLPTIKEFMGKNTLSIILIKPQFELEKDKIPKGGVVSGDILREEAINKVIDASQLLQLEIAHPAVPAQLTGRDGNQEFFLVLKNPHGR